jgi:hypothetical protein
MLTAFILPPTPSRGQPRERRTRTLSTAWQAIGPSLNTRPIFLTHGDGMAEKWIAGHHPTFEAGT